MPLLIVSKMMSCWALRLAAMLGIVVVCSMSSSSSRASAMVHNLGDSDFDKFVDKLPEEALLLVDFFKPGCRQCQRLSPVLDYLEAEWEKEEPDSSKRWFKLAKVDIEKNPRLKRVFEIQRIPDIRFVRAGKWGTYQGGRSIENIKEFKERMALVPLRAVDGEQLVELARGNEAVFVLSAEAGADAASVAPGVLLAATLSQHVATFCTTLPEVLSSLGLGASGVLPAFTKVVAAPAEQGGLLQPAVFGGSGGGASVTSASSWTVSSWVESENYGLVSEFSPNNFSRLGSLGKWMVLGIFDPKHEETSSFQQSFVKVASSFGMRHADKVIFGTVNRGQMAGFMETFNVYKGSPRVVVLDMPRDVFYTVENMRLGAGEMEAFLVDVLGGYIPAQAPSTNSARYVMKAWWVIKNGGAWSLLLLIPVVALLWVFCDSPQREEAREARRQARKEGGTEEKQPPPRPKTE